MGRCHFEIEDWSSFSTLIDKTNKQTNNFVEKGNPTQVFSREYCEIFKRNLRPKIHPCFWHNLNDFTGKEPCTRHCGVLISSHEVMKLQSFECNMIEVISANVQDFSSLILSAYFC